MNGHRKRLPGILLVLAHLQFATPMEYFAKMELHQGVGIVDHAAAPEVCSGNRDANFFLQFASQCLLHGFIGLDLSTRKFPVTWIDLACRTASEQKTAICLLQNAYGHLHQRTRLARKRIHARLCGVRHQNRFRFSPFCFHALNRPA